MINNYLDAKHDNPEVAVKLVEDSIAWCQVCRKRTQAAILYCQYNPPPPVFFFSVTVCPTPTPYPPPSNAVVDLKNREI